jgi:predicted nuclease with TOPRIM domain
VIRSNAKYGNYIETDEEGNPLRDEEGKLKVDEAAVRAMWSNPVDKKQLEISLAYTSALADLYRNLNKAKKALDRFKGKGDKEEELKQNIEAIKKEIDSLQQDIIRFTEGIDAIRTNQRGAEWSELNPDGMIAQMLSSPHKYIWWLSKARFDRPGEFLSEVGDRLYGTASLRLLGFGIQDAANAGDVLPSGTQAIAQTGGLLSMTAATPTAKEFKPKARKEYFEGKLLPNEKGEIPRKSIHGRRTATKGPFKGSVELQIKGRSEPMTVDMTNTRAWAQHTHSYAYRKARSTGIFLTNVMKNAGEVVATPAAWHTASRRYSNARKLRDDIAQTLKATNEEAERQADEVDTSGIMLDSLHARLGELRDDADAMINKARREISEYFELLQYRANLLDAAQFLTLPAEEIPPSDIGTEGQEQRPEVRESGSAAVDASPQMRILHTVAEVPEPEAKEDFVARPLSRAGERFLNSSTNAAKALSGTANRWRQSITSKIGDADAQDDGQAMPTISEPLQDVVNSRGGRYFGSLEELIEKIYEDNKTGGPSTEN